jgi:putative transposase
VSFGLRCQEAGIRPSMGSVGDCYDNALCESFFATLECELLERVALQSPREAELAVFEYIEGFYNSRRRHSALDYQSPLVFEQRHGASSRPATVTEQCA